MGVSAAIFESAGQRTEHYIPGAYSRSNNVSNPTGVTAGNLVILGKSNGGEPGKLLKFSSLSDAKDTLISGELLEAIGYAFNASNNFIPQNVGAVRVNSGTKATLQLKIDDSPLYKVQSWDWGSHCNQLKMRVTDGSVSNSKKIVVTYKDDTVTVDNIIKSSLKIEYAGDGTSAQVTIQKDKISFEAKDSESKTIDDDTFELSFEDFEYLDDLVNRINDMNYMATLVDFTSGAKCLDLDTTAAIDVTTEKTFYSNAAAFIEALESVKYIGSGNVTVLDTTRRSTPANTEGFEYFTGATAGSYTASDWIAALEKLETEDVQIIATPSSSSDVHALISAHCTSMSSTVNRKERTAILGAAIGETDENAISAAIGFNSKLISYVVDSATATNPLTGDTETIPGSMLAVMLAGMESAMAINEPLTFKTMNLLGFTKKRTNSNMENLIKYGVMVCNPNPENQAEYVCIRALTTYQGNNDLISCERSMVREDLYMNRDLRSRFTPGVGRPNSNSVDEIVSILNNTAAEWKQNGYIIPKDGGANVWNITVKISGDKVYLTYSRYLTAPRNFVFITATNHIYESTIEL